LEIPSRDAIVKAGGKDLPASEASLNVVDRYGDLDPLMEVPIPRVGGTDKHGSAKRI
jgi:hypothetical protein